MVNEVVVLALLKEGPKHGYQLLKDAARLVDREETFDTKRLYSTLKRLEQDHAIVAHPQPSPVVGAPHRKVYQLTPHGSQRLVSLLANPANAADRRRFFLSLALFHLIEGAAQEILLTERIRWLRREEEHLREVSELSLHTAWSRSVVTFQQQRVAQEMAWLAALRQPHRGKVQP